MYFVYILQSDQDATFYVGFSENIEQRVEEHNRHLAKYTSTKAPYRLVWYGAFRDKKTALSFEKYLKSSSGFAFRNKHLL